jgi:hypothetical protein
MDIYTCIYEFFCRRFNILMMCVCDDDDVFPISSIYNICNNVIVVQEEADAEVANKYVCMMAKVFQ